MKLFNTMSRQKEEFVPLGEEVGMYVCGPNLYGPSHLGHAMSYIFFDVVRRYLEYKGYRVIHVQNFTDIEDRIIEVASREGTTVQDLAERYTSRFFAEMDALNVKRAHHYPRATQVIPKIIEIVQGLIATGYAYEVDGDVYFRVPKKQDYGKLSGRAIEEMQAGARIEVDPRKEHPMDFSLWKAAKPGEPQWASPWGLGRPGWHIECSAMTLQYLGEQFDIHGGGQDVVFPHHENEIAQSEAFTGKAPVVKYWLHNGLLRPSEEQEKMTRHLANFVSIKDALERYSPDAIRLFMLSSYYRSPLTFSDEGVLAMEKGAARLAAAASVEDGGPSGELVDAEPYRERFMQAMEDDLNSSQAIAMLFDLARDINRCREEGRNVQALQAALREFGGALGLTLQAREREDNLAAQPFIELLVTTRGRLRELKQYAAADEIRSGLKKLGVILEDTPKGTVWRYELSREE